MKQVKEQKQEEKFDTVAFFCDIKERTAKATVICGLILLFAIAACTKNEPDSPTEPEPKEPTEQIDTFRINIESARQIRDEVEKIQDIKNSDAAKFKKSYYALLAVGNIEADSTDFVSAYVLVCAAALTDKNVEFNWNGKQSIPAINGHNIIPHALWNLAGKVPLGENSEYNLTYFAPTDADAVKYRADGVSIPVFRPVPPIATDTVIAVANQGELFDKINAARAAVAAGQVVAFRIDCELRLKTAELQQMADDLRELIAAEKLVVLCGTGGISPETNNTPATGGALKTLAGGLKNADNRFLVSGQDGAKEVGGLRITGYALYIINSDTISMSRWINGENNIIPERAFIDQDMLDASILSKIAPHAQERISIIGRENPNAPGGGNRLGNVSADEAALIATHGKAEFAQMIYGREFSEDELGAPFSYRGMSGFGMSSYIMGSVDLSKNGGVLNDFGNNESPSGNTEKAAMLLAIQISYEVTGTPLKVTKAPSDGKITLNFSTHSYFAQNVISAYGDYLLRLTTIYTVAKALDAKTNTNINEMKITGNRALPVLQDEKAFLLSKFGVANLPDARKYMPEYLKTEFGITLEKPDGTFWREFDFFTFYGLTHFR